MTTVTLLAEFTTDGVILKTPDGKQQKAVSVADFTKTLIAQLPATLDSTSSAVTYPLGTIFTERTVNNFRMAVYVPEHKHTYGLVDKSSGKQTDYIVPMPNVVFEIRLRINDSGSYGLEGHSYSFYCTDLAPDVVAQRLKKGFTRIGMSGESGELGRNFYYLPVTNIYPAGYLCMGANSADTVFKPDNLTMIGRYIDVCLNSPGNNDLAIPGLVSGKLLGKAYGDRNPGRMFQEWAKLEKFPYDSVQAFCR